MNNKGRARVVPGHFSHVKGGALATVVNSIIAPDPSAIAAHLEAIFAPCRGDYPNGLIELRYGQTAPNQSAYFNLRTDGVEEAVAFAAKRNSEGCNVYFGPNPRKPTTKGTASDTDVQCAFWHFADLDDADAVEVLGKRIKVLPPTLTVTTGSEPHRRPHLYWQLEEPVGNMPAWTELQRGIASALDGDAVINPSRIMRLAGTVNFPPPHKLHRGYRVELTSLRTQFSDERAPVTSRQIADAYSVRPNGVEYPVAAKLNGQTTLAAMVNQGVRPSDYIERIQRGENWHNNYRDLVAHWIDAGWSDGEIMLSAPAMTLPGFSQPDTERSVRKYISSARQKFNVPEPTTSVTVPAVAADLDVVDAFDFDEAKIPVRPWIIPGVMLAGYTHMLVAPGGSGKSLFTLQLAVTLATGTQWGSWIPRKRYRTLVINVEDDIDEQFRRLAAARHVMKPDSAMVKGMIGLVRNADNIIVAKADPQKRTVVATPIVAALRAYIIANKIDALIVDPFAETFEGDENSNSEVKWAMRIWRDEIAKPTGCAVYLVHHTVKYANGGAGDANMVRGAGAIVNSTRISATLMPMTADEAKLLNVPVEERNRYVRYDDAKANQSLLSGRAHWFRKVSVEIGNGAGLIAADEVGALDPWTPPDAFDGCSVQTIRMALERIHRGIEGDNGQPTGERFTRHRQGARWAGTVIVECFGMEPDRAQVLLRTWMDNKVIREEEYEDPVQRKKLKGLFVDMGAAQMMGAQ